MCVCVLRQKKRVFSNFGGKVYLIMFPASIYKLFWMPPGSNPAAKQARVQTVPRKGWGVRGIISHRVWRAQTKIGYPNPAVPQKTPTAQPSPAGFWHTIPLHYVPYLLHTGTLYAQTRLADLHLPIAPRPTATRRDRKLGLDGFVHFSFAPHTPLLSDKHKRGYPHVLLQFNPHIAGLPGAGFVCYNAKAWRHRDAFVPIIDAEEKAAFLLEREKTGRFPSAELLVPSEMLLDPFCAALYADCDEAAAWIEAILETLRPVFAPKVLVSPEVFPLPCAAFDGEPFRVYDHSLMSWRVLADAIGDMAGPLPAPPPLPFD